MTLARESITPQEKTLCTQQTGPADLVRENLMGRILEKRVENRQVLGIDSPFTKDAKINRRREIGILQHQTLQALKLEEEARRKVRDIEVHTRAMLQEQSGGQINQPNFELNLQKTKAANAVQNL